MPIDTTERTETGAASTDTGVRTATDAIQRKKKKILYCLDFDGVLCDSAKETFQSGWKACKLLWNAKESSSQEESSSSSSSSSSCSQQWIDDLDRDPERLEELLDDFRYVRPILYVGWESILLIRWLASSCEQDASVLNSYSRNNHSSDADGSHSKAQRQRVARREIVFRGFHAGLRDSALNAWGSSIDDYKTAFSDARNAWIAQGEKNDDAGAAITNTGADTSWIGAHGFYDGACQAVRDYLKAHGNENLYVITTKGKDFALRLLERQDLFSSSPGQQQQQQQSPSAASDGASRWVLESHVYGLGSGPKASVLEAILDDRRKRDSGNGEWDFVAVMVEDNLATLDKISRSPVGPFVLRVVASWGYNTIEQVASVVGSSSDHSNECIVLPPVRKPCGTGTGNTTACPTIDAAADALQCARRCKAKDPTGCSLASVLLSPRHAGRLLRGSCGADAETENDEDGFDFSSVSNLAEVYFQKSGVVT